MNLRQLKYLVKIVEAGNITRAAELLHVAQPALGMQIRQLESELGVDLLIRHSRGVEPSEAGTLLVERAREILSLVDAVQHEISSLAGSSREYLNVGLPTSVMATMGPRLILAAKQRIPELTISFTEDLSYALADMVAKAELDLALVYQDEEKQQPTDTLLLCEELLFVVAPDQAPQQTQLSLADVLGWPLILTGPRDSVRRLLESAAQRLETPLEMAFEVQSLAAIKHLVAQGLGAAILPLAVMQDEVEAGKLATRRVVHPRLTRNLHWVKAAGRPERKQESAFIDLLKEMLAADDADDPHGDRQRRSTQVRAQD
ncbi:LysR family transcriptional regulator [Pusillimonas sp. CC-YST705]|uniref:LysR family transcriptional regulator n=1 Tax=Mesopusillimonas faecipullorum TaxID=2755040 RepID=A0ABS8CBJ0_9BURK|nr:LysR family transcriptional regulator [Mesopusillimonas faecipullorum]MCB5363400.1 LysR family transcriptional regulator [Mesopusillimonas faecipullorum]